MKDDQINLILEILCWAIPILQLVGNLTQCVLFSRNNPFYSGGKKKLSLLLCIENINVAVGVFCTREIIILCCEY